MVMDLSLIKVAPNALGSCKRCSTDPATLKIRQENLCLGCYSRYLTTKIVKRMETFRVRSLAPGKTRKLLLSLSFGISSAVLLHALTEHRDGQLAKSGRPGYDLHVVHVCEEKTPDVQEKLDAFRSKYQQHDYTVVSLFDAGNAEEGTNGSGSTHTRGSEDQGPANGEHQSYDEFNSHENGAPPLDLSVLVNSLTSASSRRDIQGIAQRERIVKEAKRLECEGILWGDTTTSLAEKVLAETAKGRGFSLPWLTNDGERPDGVPFYFPMRDLLRKELPAFAEAMYIVPGLVELDSHSSSTRTSGKNATIDGLMKEYFESVEENYPSIVANVVRTSSKLQSPNAVADMRICGLCGMPAEQLDATVPKTAGNEADDGFEDNSAQKAALLTLCYGCEQILHGPA